MLRNILLISPSGLVIFAKEFVNPVTQVRLIGSLITAMLEFAVRHTGHRVACIELAHIAVSIVSDDVSKLTCCIFHDMEDGHDLGKLLASELLQSFVNSYAPKDATPIDSVYWTVNAHNVSKFHSKLPEVFRHSVRPVLEKLAQERGVKVALLVHEGSVVHTAGQVGVGGAGPSSIDRLGVVANLRATINSATDLMSVCGDSPSTVVIEGLTSSVRVLHTGPASNLQAVSLIVVLKKNVDLSRVNDAIDHAATLLRKVYTLMSNLQNASRT